MIQQKQNSNEEQDAVMGVATVLVKNQVKGELKADRRFKCLKSISSMTLGLTLGLFIGCCAGVWYLYNHPPTSLPGLPDSFGETSYNGLMETVAVQSITIKNQTNKIADLAAEAKNHGWLWHSHNLLIGLTEDDPARLEDFRLGRDGQQSCWEFFRANATTARMNGFIQIAHDGNHPNLAAWYSQIQDGLTEVEQLQLRLAALLEILTDEQRDRLDCRLETFASPMLKEL